MATKKLLTIPALTRKADKVFSEWVRRRDSVDWIEGDDGYSKRAGYCATCGKLTPTEGRGTGHCGHFIQRGCKTTRFLPENAALQCNYCNTYRYGEQFKFGLAIDARWGEGTALKLHEMEAEYKKNGYKYTREELEGIIEKYGSK